MITPRFPYALLERLQSCLRGGPAVDAAALTAEVQALSGSDLVRLGQAVRNGKLSLGYAWDQLDGEGAQALVAERAGAGLGALLSMHRSGRVREAAVRALALDPGPLATQALLLRIDDIVEGIRALAAQALAGRRTPASAEAFVAMAPVVTALSRRARASRGDALSGLVEFVHSPACRGALERGLGSPDAAVRATTLRWLLSSAGDDGQRVALLGRALDDPDAGIAHWAVREITSGRSTPAVRAALLPRLEAHRSPSLRRRALVARARDGDIGAVERALLDAHGDVRHAAHERWRALAGPVDPRRVYLAALDGAPRRQLLGAVAGLGEVGLASEDAGRLRPFAHAADPRLRAEAVRALGQLGADGAELEAAAHDPSGRVRREALRALAARLA